MYWFFPKGWELFQMENVICSLFFTSKVKPKGNVSKIRFIYELKWKSELTFVYNYVSCFKKRVKGIFGSQLILEEGS